MPYVAAIRRQIETFPPEEREDYLFQLIKMMMVPVDAAINARRFLPGLRNNLSARLMLAIWGAPHRMLSREALMSRLYGDRPADEWPPDSIITVYVSQVNAAVRRAGYPFRIVNMWGGGYFIELDDPSWRPPWEPPS